MNPFNPTFGDVYQKVKRHETGGSVSCLFTKEYYL